jgi:hypothetical protein
MAKAMAKTIIEGQVAELRWLKTIIEGQVAEFLHLPHLYDSLSYSESESLE